VREGEYGNNRWNGFGLVPPPDDQEPPMTLDDVKSAIDQSQRKLAAIRGHL
jgi:hypothetical protein